MTSLLSEKEKEQFFSEIELIRDVLNNSIELFKDNLRLFNGIKTENYTHYFLDIIVRIRLNCEGLENLLDCFKRDYRLKISISLLLRSIAADMLTILYLMTFYDKSDTTCKAIKNELDIISSEYLYFLKKTIKEDHELLSTLNIKTPSFEEKEKWFRKIAAELIDENGKIISKSTIRQTTPENQKEGLKNHGIFLTENEKYDRIKKYGFRDYGFIFLAFKYYSQFQHFTLMSKKFIEVKPFQDTYYMSLTLSYMLAVFDITLQICKSPNPNFSKEIENINQKIIKHFA